MEESPITWKSGGCHCGAVRYEVLAPEEIEAKECNCSICRMTGYLHLIVNADRFRFTQGEDMLTTYTFNTGTAKHHFCSTCGNPGGDTQIDQWFQATGTNKGLENPPAPAPLSGGLHHLQRVRCARNHVLLGVWPPPANSLTGFLVERQRRTSHHEEHRLADLSARRESNAIPVRPSRIASSRRRRTCRCRCAAGRSRWSCARES